MVKRALILALLIADPASAQQAGPGPGIPYTGPSDCADLSDAKTGCSTIVGTIATQAANSVAITGGTINATTLGASTPSSSKFTTVSASGQITSTATTGTAPLVVASTTNVANLNASSLSGATFASPGAIGGTAASTGKFTSIVTTPLTVATLPGTPVDGQRSFVTDADACVFATAVTHTAGTTHCPVYWDAGASAWEAG